MQKTFKADKSLLLFPVKYGGRQAKISISVNGKALTYFTVPVAENGEEADGPLDFYGEFPISQYEGEEITVEGDVPESFMDRIRLSDEPYRASCSRPAVHFTPDHGWMNDPNGLIFDGEEYHLYFQHNPFGKPWGNMSWGHAVSGDLLRWEQRESVLFPDRFGTMFSGSGIVDEQNTLGHGTETKVVFYTAADGVDSTGKKIPAVQCLAYSTDGGNSYTKDGVIVPTYTVLNRDPKVYYYAPGGHYYMVLYLDGSEFAVLNSKDLKNWTVTQRITLEPLWECPDLFPLKDERGEEIWVFVAADGFYYTGYFDGERFTPLGNVKKGFATSIPYAAQTFYGTGDRRILLPWLRLKDPHKPYTGAMGLPRELSIRTGEEGPELVLSPIREYVRGTETVVSGEFSEETKLPLQDNAAHGFYLSGTDFPETVLPSFTLALPGLSLAYDKDALTLTVEGVLDGHEDLTRAPKAESEAIVPEKPGIRVIRLTEALPSLFLLLDGNILEFTLKRGRELWVLELQEEAHAGTAVFRPEKETALTLDRFEGKK